MVLQSQPFQINLCSEFCLINKRKNLSFRYLSLFMPPKGPRTLLDFQTPIIPSNHSSGPTKLILWINERGFVIIIADKKLLMYGFNGYRKHACKNQFYKRKQSKIFNGR